VENAAEGKCGSLDDVFPVIQKSGSAATLIVEPFE